MSQLRHTMWLQNRSLNFKNTRDFKKMKNNLMTGLPVRPKVALEPSSHNILTVREWQFNGINIIPCITMKTTPHLKLSKDISSISSTLTSTISRRLLNIIYRRLKVQTTVSLSLKLGLLIRILLLRYSEKNGILLKNRDSNLFSIKVFFSFILTLKSPNSEFDIYQYYSAKS